MKKQMKSGTMARVTPNGKCWCGCGEATAEDKFFLPGHDRAAEAAIIRQQYGDVAQFVYAHGLHGQKKTGT